MGASRRCREVPSDMVIPFGGALGVGNGVRWSGKGQSCLVGTQMVTLVGKAKWPATVVGGAGFRPDPNRMDMTRLRSSRARSW